MISPETFLAVARPLLEQPTAPFREAAVRACLRELLAECPHVRLEEDRAGNLLAWYERAPAGGPVPAPRFALAAHMDHPGYVGAEFLGGVPAAYLQKDPPTETFGDFRMWALPACVVEDGLLRSRACDDLIGCAAIVAALRELEAAAFPGACLGLFTRAEEVGFAGALQLARSGLVPAETTIISLETSSERGGPVRMGAGVIVRVGDRTSIFDSDATALLVRAAEEAGLPVQRALMSGGTCEATAYQLYGYRTAGICVALGHYHNCAPGETIAPEYVSLEDAGHMAALCVAAVTTSTALPDVREALRARLEHGLERFAHLW